MKRFLILLLSLLLLSSCALAQGTVINKVKGESPDFAFAQNAVLLEVYFPKIYGCDAALVRLGDQSMLIDCGGMQWEETYNLLKRIGITELTYAVNSHPDADHIGGFNSVAKRIPIGEFILGFPEDYDAGDEVRFRVYEDLHKYGVPFRQVTQGDTIGFGDAQITVLQRTDEDLPRVNNKSVMLMIEYGERRIFFTGDTQAPGQQRLTDDPAEYDLDTDILKFPHHGYKPMQDDFLSRTSPDLVIATSGSINDEGLVDLREREIPYLQTANAALRLTTDGEMWVVEKY